MTEESSPSRATIVRLVVAATWTIVLVGLLAADAGATVAVWMLLGVVAIIGLRLYGEPVQSRFSQNPDATVLTATYANERAMRRDIEQKVTAGYAVQSTNITEHRGFFLTLIGILTFGLFLLFFPKRKHFHVTYLRNQPARAGSF